MGTLKGFRQFINENEQGPAPDDALQLAEIGVLPWTYFERSIKEFAQERHLPELRFVLAAWPYRMVRGEDTLELLESWMEQLDIDPELEQEYLDDLHYQNDPTDPVEALESNFSQAGLYLHWEDERAVSSADGELVDSFVVLLSNQPISEQRLDELLNDYSR